MTAVRPAPGKNGRILPVAIFASLLFHLAFVIVALIGVDVVARSAGQTASSAFAPPKNEIVEITSPLIMERRPAAKAGARGSDAPKPHVVPPAHFDFAPAMDAPGSGAAVAPVNAAEQELRDAIARHNRAPGATVDLHDPAQVPGRYRLTMQGKHAKLSAGQGIYYPVRGWKQDGLDYYDVEYEYVYPDGTSEKGPVPWPIHFDPATDPFFSADFVALAHTPLPPPPVNFTPPGNLGKALRTYFPNLRFEDSDS